MSYGLCLISVKEELSLLAQSATKVSATKPNFKYQDNRCNSECNLKPRSILAPYPNPNVMVPVMIRCHNNFDTYFTRLSQAFEVSAIATASSKL